MLDVLKSESTCLRRQTAAIVTSQDGSIIGTGYNGVPRKIKHCTKETCVRRDSKAGENLDKCPGAHAEANCIANSAREGIRLKGAILYCSHKPCLSCAKLIINAGIKEIAYWEDYPSNKSLDLLQEAGIDVNRCWEVIHS